MIEYDVKELLSRIEEKLDDFRREFRDEHGNLRERVTKVEEQMAVWHTLGQDRLQVWEHMRADVEELKRNKVGVDAVARYRKAIWALGIGLAGVGIPFVALVIQNHV